MVETTTPAGVVTCTLTIKDDRTGEYDDDLQYQRAEGKTQQGSLGRSEITRLVVKLLNRWVDDYYQQCQRNELKVLGKALYAIAFGDESTKPDVFPLRFAFESTLRQCRQRKMRLRFRLVIEPDATNLATYPWEFMYLEPPEQDGFFLAGEDTSLSLTRYVPNASSWDGGGGGLDEDGKLRILVVVSTPAIPEMTDLSVGAFVDQIQALDPSRFSIQTVRSPTQEQLQAEIRDLRPHVIHFIGHGRPGALALRKDDAILQQEREDYDTRCELGEAPSPVSEAVWIDEATACAVLRTGQEDPDAPSRLIFLHACEGAKPNQTRASLEGFGDVARALARSDRISGVIAMQYTIRVEDAELLATTFYQAVADGQPVDDAMTKARKALAETPRPNRPQAWNDRGFGTPVIYLRSERALVPPPLPVVPSPGVAGGKEPCPNGKCNGYVRRTQQAAYCKVCREPFAVCPKCEELVVPKPGWECSNCDYVYESPEPQSVGATDSTQAGTPPTHPGAQGGRAGWRP